MWIAPSAAADACMAKACAHTLTIFPPDVYAGVEQMIEACVACLKSCVTVSGNDVMIRDFLKELYSKYNEVSSQNKHGSLLSR